MAEQRPFKAPPGTRDVLPPESRRWAALVAHFAQQVERAGYDLLLGPMFEELAVFQRVGESTEIVTKEMYDFEDKGGRRIALRPEGTASVMRAYNQHRPAGTPWKVWYVGPNFRYERPQAGRYRQHHQLGIEAIGSDDPDLDVEVVAIQAELYRSLGLEQVELLVNSMGSPQDRAEYTRRLGHWLQERRELLDPSDRETAALNPMRVLDSRRQATRALTAEAPLITESLGAASAERFERVLAGLEAVGIRFRIEPRLVRGLDYYTHTTFEFQAASLQSAQNGIGGGGRYDGLAAALGGAGTPGIGFGTGIERILLACDAEGAFAGTERPAGVFVVDLVDGAAARDLVVRLWRAGISAERAYGGRSLKAQMKVADRSGAAVAAIIGADELADGEVSIRDLRGAGGQRRVASSEVVDELRKHL